MKTNLAYVTVRTSVAVALAALSTVVGCGNDSLPFSELQPAAVGADCHFEVLCHGYPDEATCMASVQTQPHLFDTLRADIASGKVIYDGVSARACIDAINGLSTCSRDSFEALGDTAACNKIFTGTIAVGGSCFFSDECVGGGNCLSTGSCTSYQCCAGTCQTPPTLLPVGGDCSSSGPAACSPGTTCISDPTSGTSTCRAPIAAGGPCSNSSTCANGLYCDLSATMTCKPLVATGGACNPALGSQDCSGLQDVCDSTTSVCTPPLALGSPCTSAPETCISYASCDATSGTCVERPAVGAACDPNNGPSCLAGNCDTTSATCVLPSGAGACS